MRNKRKLHSARLTLPPMGMAFVRPRTLVLCAAINGRSDCKLLPLKPVLSGFAVAVISRLGRGRSPVSSCRSGHSCIALPSERGRTLVRLRREFTFRRSRSNSQRVGFECSLTTPHTQIPFVLIRAQRERERGREGMPKDCLSDVRCERANERASEA